MLFGDPEHSLIGYGGKRMSPCLYLLVYVGFGGPGHVDTCGQELTRLLQVLHELQPSARGQDPPPDEAVDCPVDVFSGNYLEGQARDHP